MPITKRTFLPFLLVLAVSLLGAVAIFKPVVAAPSPQSAGHSDCMNCHGKDNFSGQFKNGETISLTFNQEMFSGSMHGRAGLGCQACHSDYKMYPHQNSTSDNCSACHFSGEPGAPLVVPLSYDSPRELLLEVADNCGTCHAAQQKIVSGSIHTRFQLEGNLGAPGCADCHEGHSVTSPGEPRTKITETCATCHLATYSAYKNSVHGKTLLADGNLDVPTCEECHGAHNATGPSDAVFRDATIQTCGNCHSDAERMDKYGLSTQVFDTYLDDFHGRTVSFSFRNASNRPSIAATCYDCHGIHNIRAADDPYSAVYPENLQKTCQKCHSDASVRFPEAWLAHTPEEWESNPFLHIVNIVYKWLITLVIGGFIGYIVLDALRRFVWMRKSHHQDVKKIAEEK